LAIAIINWKNLAAFDDTNHIGLWCGRSRLPFSLHVRPPASIVAGGLSKGVTP
jgi:hypothetical protein